MEELLYHVFSLHEKGQRQVDCDFLPLCFSLLAINASIKHCHGRKHKGYDHECAICAPEGAVLYL